MENKNDWRQRVRELKVSENEMTHFESSWQKVEERLVTNKKKRSPNLIYWLAAAAIIVTFIIPQLVKKEESKPDDLVINHPSVIPKANKKNISTIVDRINPASATVTTPTIKSSIKPNMKNPGIQPVLQHPAVTPTLLVADPLNVNDTVTSEPLVQNLPTKHKKTSIHDHDVPTPSDPTNTVADNKILIVTYPDYERTEQPSSNSINLNAHN